MRYGAWPTELFVILDHFLHFNPANKLENWNFEKMKKTCGDTIILHMCTINDNYMMRYQARRAEFCVILNYFSPFYTPNNPKNQNFETMKKNPRNMPILHKCGINDNNMMYGSWDMRRDRQNFLSVCIVFFPFTLLTTLKIKILKNWQKHREISSSFYTSSPKIMIICYTVP